MISAQDVRNAFLWPNAKELLGVSFRGTLYRNDKLVRRLERLVTEGQAWTPISGATKRTWSTSKIHGEIEAQNRHLLRLINSNVIRSAQPLELIEFPLDPTGDGDSRIIGTSSNILYLIDSTYDFVKCFSEAFSKESAKSLSELLEEDIGTFVYISNSIEAGGRAFKGDPFTGQAAAYSRIFGWDIMGQKERNFIAYYPNQLLSQFFTEAGSPPSAKGVKMLRQEAALIIANNGLCLQPQRWEVVS